MNAHLKELNSEYMRYRAQKHKPVMAWRLACNFVRVMELAKAGGLL